MRDIEVSASRGTIRDVNGNVLAMSATVYKLILSPRDLLNSVDPADFQNLVDILRSTSPDLPVVTYDCKLNYKGAWRWTQIVARAIWSSDEPYATRP